MRALAWHSLEDARGEPAASIGDIVRTGENFHPHYRVIAVSADRAWIRDVQRGADHIISLSRCRKIDNGRAHKCSDSSNE